MRKLPFHSYDGPEPYLFVSYAHEADLAQVVGYARNTDAVVCHRSDSARNMRAVKHVFFVWHIEQALPITKRAVRARHIVFQVFMVRIEVGIHNSDGNGVRLGRSRRSRNVPCLGSVDGIEVPLLLVVRVVWSRSLQVECRTSSKISCVGNRDICVAFRVWRTCCAIVLQVVTEIRLGSRDAIGRESSISRIFNSEPRW